MALTLITGPANAAKAGAVLDRLRAALPREPRLVVPTWADVDHYQRELAAAGIVFGADVVTFSRLVRELAAAAGLSGRPLGPVARERVVRAAVRDTRLEVLAASARAPGLRRRRGGAVRGAAAHARRPGPLHARAAHLVRRRRRARPRRVSWRRCTPPTTAGSSGSGRATPRASPARRWTRCASAPRRFGSRPVFLYGFDDLTPLQLDAVETLSGRVGAEVCVALPYEAGRAAFAGRAGTVELLKPLAAEHVELRRRARSTTRRAPAARCTTSSGSCSRPTLRACRPTAPCGCWRRAASARRPRSSPRRCSS